MSKFVIECPACGKFAEARTGFFARKKIDCACGHTINVRTDKMTSRDCPHCGNTVVFDQSKGAAAKCPVCGEPINTLAEQTTMAEFSCGQCGVRLRAAKSASSYICPVCDHVNDVAERLKSEEIKKDGLASVIKYEGDNETLVWKHPVEDFSFGSQLIVHESQEAIFFRDGQALDLFGPGRYTLETQQLPLLEKIYKLPTDTEGTFHSEVYFINKTVQMSLKWGTPDKIRFIDPLTSVPLEIGASGELNLQVSDARRLIVKLVGTQNGIAWDDRENFTRSVQSAFRPLIASAVKENLPAIIKSQQIDLLEIDERSNEISALLQEKLLPGFEEYGLTIPQFYVTHIVLPEDDPNFKRIRDLHTIMLQTRVVQAEATVKTVQAQSEATVTAARRQVELEKQTTETEIARREAERKLIQAQADAQAQRLAGLTEAEIMRAKGYDHKDEIKADVKKAYAAGLGQMSGNGGGLGDLASLGVTLGAMGGVIGMTKEAVAPMFQQPTAPIEAPVPKTLCPSCGAEVPANAKFCLECGSKIELLGEDEVICPACGKKTHKGKFCMECGAELLSNAKFCLECGEKA